MFPFRQLEMINVNGKQTPTMTQMIIFSVNRHVNEWQMHLIYNTHHDFIHNIRMIAKYVTCIIGFILWFLHIWFMDEAIPEFIHSFRSRINIGMRVCIDHCRNASALKLHTRHMI